MATWWEEYDAVPIMPWAPVPIGRIHSSMRDCPWWLNQAWELYWDRQTGWAQAVDGVRRPVTLVRPNEPETGNTRWKRLLGQVQPPLFYGV